MKTCILENCTNQQLARGLCRAHYLKARRDGSLNALALPTAPKLPTDHQLLSKNPETKRGVCSICGDTEIVSKIQRGSQIRWRCRTPIRLSGTRCKKYSFGQLEEYHMATDLVHIREELLVVQKNVCALCKKGESSGKQLSIDHCHTTGKIRGLLCSRCNLGLGLFKDNQEVLAAAIKYLQA
jgi:hypothetical protein